MSATGDFVEGNSLVEQLAQPGSRLRKELAMAVSAVNNVLVSEQQTALTQIWVPKRNEKGDTVLSCQGLPYAISGEGDLLALFRCVSCRYTFCPTSTDTTRHGSIGRVFLSHRPELTNDVQNFPKDMYLRVQEAQTCGMHSLCVVPLWMPEISRSAPVAILEVLQPDEQPSFDELMAKVTDSMSKVRVGKIAVQPPLPDLLFDNSRSAQCPVHLELHKGAGFDMESAGWRNNLGDERLNMVFGETMPSGLHRADSSSVMNADDGNTESLTKEPQSNEKQSSQPPSENHPSERPMQPAADQKEHCAGAQPISSQSTEDSALSNPVSSPKPTASVPVAVPGASRIQSHSGATVSAPNSVQNAVDRTGLYNHKASSLAGSAKSPGMEDALDLFDSVTRDKSWQTKPRHLRNDLAFKCASTVLTTTSDPEQHPLPPKTQTSTLPHTMHGGALHGMSSSAGFEAHIMELNRKRKYQGLPEGSHSMPNVPQGLILPLNSQTDPLNNQARAMLQLPLVHSAPQYHLYPNAPHQGQQHPNQDTGSNFRGPAVSTYSPSHYSLPPNSQHVYYAYDHPLGARPPDPNGPIMLTSSPEGSTMRMLDTGDVYHTVRRTTRPTVPVTTSLSDKIMLADTAHMRMGQHQHHNDHNAYVRHTYHGLQSPPGEVQYHQQLHAHRSLHASAVPLWPPHSSALYTQGTPHDTLMNAPAGARYTNEPDPSIDRRILHPHIDSNHGMEHVGLHLHQQPAHLSPSLHRSHHSQDRQAPNHAAHVPDHRTGVLQRTSSLHQSHHSPAHQQAQEQQHSSNHSGHLQGIRTDIMQQAASLQNSQPHPTYTHASNHPTHLPGPQTNGSIHQLDRPLDAHTPQGSLHGSQHYVARHRSMGNLQHTMPVPPPSHLLQEAPIWSRHPSAIHPDAPVYQSTQRSNPQGDVMFTTLPTDSSFHQYAEPTSSQPAGMRSEPSTMPHQNTLSPNIHTQQPNPHLHSQSPQLHSVNVHASTTSIAPHESLAINANGGYDKGVVQSTAATEDGAVRTGRSRSVRTSVRSSQCGGDMETSERSTSIGPDGVPCRPSSGQGVTKAIRNRINRTDGGIGKKLTLDILKAHFGNGLKEAAESLSMCPTTLKRACRRLGIRQWPRQVTIANNIPDVTRPAEKGLESSGNQQHLQQPVQQPECQLDADFQNEEERMKIALQESAGGGNDMQTLLFDFENDGTSFGMNYSFQDNIMNLLEFEDIPTS